MTKISTEMFTHSSRLQKKRWLLTMSAVMERILEMVLVIYHRMERFITIVRKIFLSPLDVINSVVLGSNLSVKDSVPECAKGMTVGLAYKPALVQMFVRIVLLKEKKSHSERIGKRLSNKKVLSIINKQELDKTAQNFADGNCPSSSFETSKKLFK